MKQKSAGEKAQTRKKKKKKTLFIRPSHLELIA